MNKYDEKKIRIQNHLISHPKDYQSVISLFKANNDSIQYERYKASQKRKALIAKFRRDKYGKRA